MNTDVNLSRSLKTKAFFHIQIAPTSGPQDRPFIKGDLIRQRPQIKEPYFAHQTPSSRAYSMGRLIQAAPPTTSLIKEGRKTKRKTKTKSHVFSLTVVVAEVNHEIVPFLRPVDEKTSKKKRDNENNICRAHELGSTKRDSSKEEGREDTNKKTELIPWICIKKTKKKKKKNKTKQNKTKKVYSRTEQKGNMKREGEKKTTLKPLTGMSALQTKRQLQLFGHWWVVWPCSLCFRNVQVLDYCHSWSAHP